VGNSEEVGEKMIKEVKTKSKTKKQEQTKNPLGAN
jgi:hypothetical protein